MSDVLTQIRKKIGTTFEIFIRDSLGYFDEVYGEFAVRDFGKKYNVSITKIDVAARLGNYWFFIQCKFKKDKVNTGDVTLYVQECTALKNKLGNNFSYHLIYLTRIKNPDPYTGPNPLSTVENAVNLYLYENETELDGFTVEKNMPNYYTLLMKLHRHMFNITSKTNIYPTLKEWDSLDVLMAY
jgi:hypothetical protein